MPRTSRSRVIAADREAVWQVVADPHHLARWWPKVSRVEDVQEDAGAGGPRWTEVLTTASGKGVRAKFTCRHSREPEEFSWEQQIEDTPFAKVFRSSVTSVGLDEGDGGTQVTIEIEQRLRGMSRLGGFMLKRASGEQLEQALDGLERAMGKRAGD